MIRAIRRWNTDRQRRKRWKQVLSLLSFRTPGQDRPLVSAVAGWTIERLLKVSLRNSPLPTTLAFQLKAARGPWQRTLAIRASMRR